MTGDGECDEGCREERGEAKTDAGTYFSGKIDELGGEGRGGGSGGIRFFAGRRSRNSREQARLHGRCYTGVIA